MNDPRINKEWDDLLELILAFAHAQEQDSWKGGGDPESYREIELELELSKEKLLNHIRVMRSIRGEEEIEDSHGEEKIPKARQASKTKPKAYRRSAGARGGGDKKKSR